MRSIVRITEWPTEALEALIHESENEGFRFLDRLQDEWRSNTNRFSNAGEAFFGVMENQELLAVGGLNRQSESCGRLRRFYVKQNARRRGVGRLLARHILGFAADHYSHVVLRTDTEAADHFYVALGFVHLPPGGDATHTIETKKTTSVLAPRPSGP